MGILKHLASGRQVYLAPRHLAGRASRCDLLLSNPRVSGEHAVVLWSRGWQLRDLGSRNGTFVNGQQVAPGEPWGLNLGDQVAFGGQDDAWALVDAGGPEPIGESAGEGRVVGRAGILALPSAENPVVSVFQDGAGRWLAERAEGREALLDGQSIEVGGATWRLQLPEPLAITTGAPLVSLGDCSLAFDVSLDEEHVRMWLVTPREALDLGARSHHYLLLTLARARLSDAAEEGAGPSSAHGWMYQDQLAKRLGLTPSLLNIHVHRARSQLAELEVVDAAGVVERRAAAKQLRIGIGEIEVRRG